MKKAEKLAKLRQSIIDALKKTDDQWVTTDGVKNKMVFEKLESEDITLEQIGNNLRILKDKGVVSDTKIDGKRCWSLTGNEFDNRPAVRMVVAFPKATHESICEGALKTGQSKTSYIIESVEKRVSECEE